MVGVESGVENHEKPEQKVSKTAILAYFEIPILTSEARIGFSGVELTLDHLLAVSSYTRHLQLTRFHMPVQCDFDHFTDAKDDFTDSFTVF